MVVAVLVSITVMLLAADPLGFINKTPTVVMLALGFLSMIGMVLIADGFGVHLPKGYIYAAMAFSAGVEALNMWSRTRSVKRAKGVGGDAALGLVAARHDQPERDPV
jgi:predicted tellurium resistance membrane protein TerC